MAEPAIAAGEDSPWALPYTLSVGALGLALVLLVALAWATGAVYLVVRAGLPAPINLALTDTVHIYVGVASVVFICAKVLRVGLRTRVAGVPEVVLWQRWISWSLMVLYGAVYGTGALLLAPFPLPVRDSLVNAHLLTSVWAAAPTTWHAWHYRRRATVFLPRVKWVATARRFWFGLAFTLLPLAGLAAFARAAAPLTEIGAGGSWTGDGLSGVFLDRLQLLSDGHSALAGGSGLYITGGLGQPWRQVLDPHNLVLGLAEAPDGAIYVGTSKGLFRSQLPAGPFRLLPLPLPMAAVHGIAVLPGAQELWVSSRTGFWRSRDGGASWSLLSQGLRNPASAWAVSYFHGVIFGSDASAVYRWDGAKWMRVSDQPLVVSLDVSPAGDRLFASSMGAGIRMLEGESWTRADAGLAGAHGSSPAIHVTSVTSGSDGKTYATLMTSGVALSLDRGESWSRLPAALPAGGSWRVVQVGSDLLLATNHGALLIHQPTAPKAGFTWWMFVVVAAIVVPTAGVLVSAVPGRRWDPSPATMTV